VDNIKVAVVETRNGPERLMFEVELHFTDGPLAGFKLVGFSVWRDPEGQPYLTFPSRAFGAGTERRFFDYLRPQKPGNNEVAKALKARILAEALAERERPIEAALAPEV
jgi:hypothetical protein